MGYAVFAQRKIVLDAQLNSAQLRQTMCSDEQFKLATDTLSLQQQLTSMNASQAGQLADEYERLSKATGEDERASINAEIKSMEESFEQEIDAINRQIYLVSVKEQAFEMEVKRLDTVVSAIQQELEATEEAEGQAIERATPKFKGVG